VKGGTDVVVERVKGPVFAWENYENPRRSSMTMEVGKRRNETRSGRDGFALMGTIREVTMEQMKCDLMQNKISLKKKKKRERRMRKNAIKISVGVLDGDDRLEKKH